MPGFEWETHVWIHCYGSVNEMFRLKASKGGFVLIVVVNDRVPCISAWFVEMEELDFHSIELSLPFYVL